MTDFNFDELIRIATCDLDLFEKKRVQLITSFMNTFSNSPDIGELEQIQKNIDNRVSFNMIENDPLLFEENRQEVINSFFNSLSSDENKHVLLNMQAALESKMNS